MTAFDGVTLKLTAPCSSTGSLYSLKSTVVSLFFSTVTVFFPLMVPASSSRSYVPVAAVTSILSVTPTSWLFPILAYPPSNALTPVNLIYPCPTSTTIE